MVGLIVFGGALIRTLDRSKPLDPFSDDGSGAVVANFKKPLVLAPKTGLPLEGDIRKHLRSIEGDAESTPTPASPKPGTAKTASRPERPQNEKPERKYRAPHMPSLPAGLLKEPVDAAESAVEAAEKLVPAIELRPETLRLAQPAFLLRPDISSRLGLSHTQQVRLRRMLVELRTADQSLSKALAEKEPELILGRRSLGILTREQQRTLAQLQATLPAESTAGAGSTP